jgi:hypothetical protein
MTQAFLWRVVIGSAAGVVAWLWRARGQEKPLFEAAAKAGEAGEAVLSLQLYARLIARYPESTLAARARDAVEAQKKRLATARAPGTSGPG